MFVLLILLNEPLVLIGGITAFYFGAVSLGAGIDWLYGIVRCGRAEWRGHDECDQTAPLHRG
jgi:hypothetical protein